MELNEERTQQTTTTSANAPTVVNFSIDTVKQWLGFDNRVISDSLSQLLELDTRDDRRPFDAAMTKLRSDLKAQRPQPVSTDNISMTSVSTILGAKEYRDWLAPILDIYRLCAKHFLPAGSLSNPVVEQLQNQIRFLSALMLVEDRLKTGDPKKTKPIRQALGQLVIDTFQIDPGQVVSSDRKKPQSPKARDFIAAAMNTVRADMERQGFYFLVPDMEGVAPKHFGADKLKFGISRYINRDKENSNEIIPGLILGKIPQRSDFETAGAYANGSQPTLVISCVARDEHLTTREGLNRDDRQIALPARWSLVGAQQCFVELFIDYGRPCRRNPKWREATSPLTGEKFQSNTEWNVYLDRLYQDIYSAAVLTALELQKGGRVLVHCKAGKGRSLLELGTFLALHPALLPLEQQEAILMQLSISRLDQINYANAEQVSKLVAIVHGLILSIRSHVDHDEQTLDGIVDCVMHGASLRLQNDPKFSPEAIIAHFNQGTANHSLDALSVTTSVATSTYSSLQQDLDRRSETDSDEETTGPVRDSKKEKKSSRTHKHDRKSTDKGKAKAKVEIFDGPFVNGNKERKRRTPDEGKKTSAAPSYHHSGSESE